MFSSLLIDGTDWSELCAALRPTLREATSVIMRHYESRGKCDVAGLAAKKDGSPVTAADHEAEEIITASLRRLTPNWPVIAEEAVARGDTSQIDEWFWLVDPLDGTKEFLNGTGDFTINVGLVHRDRALFGIIAHPPTNMIFASTGPGSAMRWNHRDEAVRITARSPAVEGYDLLISRSHDDGRTLSWLETLPIKGQQAMGSALKFCRIAEGAADLYLRLGPTSEWDTAAGQALLEASGGGLCTLEGQPFRYGKAGFRNRGFLAYGAGQRPALTPQDIQAIDY